MVYQRHFSNADYQVLPSRHSDSLSLERVPRIFTYLIMSLDDSDRSGLCPCSLLILIVIHCVKDFITNCRKFLNSAVILGAIFLFFLVLLLQDNQTYNFKHPVVEKSLLTLS